MPAVRNIPTRRSRRLSKQDPYKYQCEWEAIDAIDVEYPSSKPDITAASSSSSPLGLSSSASAFVPTASHARKRKQGHIPRPPNAFMIFRSDMWRKQKLTPNVERDHRHVSVIAGLCWKSLTPEEQKPYQVRAAMAKERHIRENPGYKYSPVSRKQKSAKRKVRNDDKSTERCHVVASLIIQGYEGAALETAVNMGYEEHRLDIADPNTPVPAPSIPSTPRSRRHSSRLWRPYKECPSVAIKAESPTTAVPNSEQEPSVHQGFVPTSEIPQLDLSASAGIEKLKLDDAFDYNLQPPNFAPSYAAPPFGIKPEAVEFTQSYLLSMDQATNEQPDNYFSNDLFSDSDFNLSSLCNPIFDFPNPFATQTVYNDTALALLEHQQLYDEPVAPNAVDPFLALTGDSHAADFGYWV